METDPGRQAQSWEWTVPFAAPSVPRARAELAVALVAAGVDRATIDDVCAVATELLANAIRHARPRSDGVVELAVALNPATIQIAVADGGSATVPALVHPPELSRGGRGLGIVHTLTSNWGVREAADGNTVFGVINRSG